MNFDDFCKCTVEELDEIFKSWRELKEAESKEKWELMRLHAVMTMQPHCKKRLRPDKILPFPWEKKADKHPTPAIDKDTQKQRVSELLKRS